MKKGIQGCVCLLLSCILVGKVAAASAPRFAVMSDPHFYDTRLGTRGAAFERYLAGDRKMLRENEAILDSAIRSIKGAGVDFVVVCGDLTKDGALTSHLRFARKLAELEAAGIDYDLDGMPFQDYTRAYVWDWVHEVAVFAPSLAADASDAEAGRIASLTADALLGHYAGDESPDPDAVALAEALAADPRLLLQTLGTFILQLMRDIPPADASLVISDLPKTNRAKKLDGKATGDMFSIWNDSDLGFICKSAQKSESDDWGILKPFAVSTD